jgi:hypothetical protein
MPFDGSDFAGLGALDKIDRVIERLSREEAWCKGKLRTDDGRRCIVGAMQDVQAVLELTRPVMLAIQQVARGRYSGIEAFNDHRATTHAQVMEVLHQARANVLAGIIGEPAPARAALSVGWFSRFLGWARAGA